MAKPVVSAEKEAKLIRPFPQSQQGRPLFFARLYATIRGLPTEGSLEDVLCGLAAFHFVSLALKGFDFAIFNSSPSTHGTSMRPRACCKGWIRRMGGLGGKGPGIS